MRRLRRAISLPLVDKLLTLEALWRLIVARINVATSNARLDTLYVPVRSPKRFEAGRLSGAVARAARLVPGATCLPQALAAAEMFRFHGHACELRIGLRDDAGLLSAHAWVEADGAVVLGSDNSKDNFIAFPALTVSNLP